MDSNFTFKKNNFYWQSWEANKTNGLILIIHGMGEHGGRYAHVAKFFNQFNYTVCALDHYGHGKSDGKRGDMPSLEFMYDYMAEFIHEVEKKYGKKPTVLYGHSMGGNAVANYLIWRKHSFKTAIITSPWFTLPTEPPAWKVFMAKVMMKIFPSFPDKTNLDASAISRNRVEVDKYIHDPLVHDSITPRMFLPMQEAGLMAIDYAERIHIPVLLMHGKSDQLTNITGSVLFYENNPEYVTFQAWEGGYHELHNDIIQSEVLEFMIDWLAGRMSS